MLAEGPTAQNDKGEERSGVGIVEAWRGQGSCERFGAREKWSASALET